MGQHDHKRLRADVVAYLRKRSGIRRFLEPLLGPEPDSQYLLLAEGLGFVVSRYRGRETAEVRFECSSLESLQVRRSGRTLTVRFRYEGRVHRLDLANEQLVSMAQPKFLDPDEPPPLTVAEQAALYLQDYVTEKP